MHTQTGLYIIYECNYEFMLVVRVHVYIWQFMYRMVNTCTCGYRVRAKCLYGSLVGQALGMPQAIPTHGQSFNYSVCLLLQAVATTLYTLQMVVPSELQMWLVKWIIIPNKAGLVLSHFKVGIGGSMESLQAVHTWSHDMAILPYTPKHI